MSSYISTDHSKDFYSNIEQIKSSMLLLQAGSIDIDYIIQCLSNTQKENYIIKKEVIK